MPLVAFISECEDVGGVEEYRRPARHGRLTPECVILMMLSQVVNTQVSSHLRQPSQYVLLWAGVADGVVFYCQKIPLIDLQETGFLREEHMAVESSVDAHSSRFYFSVGCRFHDSINGRLPSLKRALAAIH
jgi:hypothetical protein